MKKIKQEKMNKNNDSIPSASSNVKSKNLFSHIPTSTDETLDVE